ncbi:MAG: phospholipase D family protein [Euryarchaeota archaeon]|jgi:phosphatidylserine/phosphatidylglycerophosphate/cardiolipin synthase-like enzyme|nr:phospholipase D family protein [Euryarchaeota archaeon]
MEISDNKRDLIETIREYRKSKEYEELISEENKMLKDDNQELKTIIKDLSSEIIEYHNLLDEVNELKDRTRLLGLENEKLKNQCGVIVTTPRSTSSVIAEIRDNLSKAKKEVLVCSPWITYLLEEFNQFKRGVTLKVVINFRKEDIESGITDLDKIRVLRRLGAQIRYNNDLHAKMIFIDGTTAIISSANLTKRGLSVNYEAGVILKNNEHVQNALKFFKGVWEESEPLNEDMIREMSR